MSSETRHEPGRLGEVPDQEPRRTEEDGARLYYLTAFMATCISADTSYQYFRDIIGITAVWERVAFFTVLELFLVACGWGTRSRVLRGKSPGAPRWAAWLACGASAFMAFSVSGPGEGLMRVVLGPVAAISSLHLALGIIRANRGGPAAGMLARVGRELRERMLSRLGLGDDQRDAVQRTRDRARDRAARLATARHVPWRSRRLARAVRLSGAALDLGQAGRLVAEVAALRHVSDLATEPFPSPWRAAGGTGSTSGSAPGASTGQYGVSTGPGGTGGVLDGQDTSTGHDVLPANDGGVLPPGKEAPDDVLIAWVRAHVRAEKDGTVPVRRAASALGVGTDKAKRLLRLAGLYREPPAARNGAGEVGELVDLGAAGVEGEPA